jgi:hypothetical protein
LPSTNKNSIIMPRESVLWEAAAQKIEESFFRVPHQLVIAPPE